MSDSAVFIGWGRPVTGREQEALQVFHDSMEYWKGLVEQGDVERFETFALDPHGGDLYGFAILIGAPEKLARVTASEQFMLNSLRADLVLEHLGVVGAVSGEPMAKEYAVWASQAATLVHH